MSNDINVFERLFKLWGNVCKLIVDGRRDPEMVSGVLQKIVDEPMVVAKTPVKFIGNFSMFVDLGIITVPNNYVHDTRLAEFKGQHQRGEDNSFSYYDDTIRDQNFPNPSRILRPGDRLRVQVFRQVVDGTTTSEERMAFLAKLKSVYVGPQGASLVFDQKRDQLPKGKRYASFDKEDCLYEDSLNYHRVPCIGRSSEGIFSFELYPFEEVWLGDDMFFCFLRL